MKTLKSQILTLSISVFVLLGIGSCSSDSDPDPCSTTPLLAISATSENFTISATATGGKGPYTFQLDDGTFQTSETFTGLTVQEYSVTAKDANGCTKSTRVTVTDPCGDGTLAVSSTVEGYTINASGTGGTPPYTYSIDGANFSTNSEITAKKAGTYTLTVKDANDCTSTAEVSIVDPCAEGTLAVETTVEGYTITANTTGGTAPYTFSIDGENFQESNTFAELAVGTYTVTVKDANACTAMAADILVDPCAEGTLAVEGGVEGYTITANASGGTAPYTFSIDGQNFQESNVFTDLAVGSYTVTVRDTYSCEAQSVDINVDPCAGLAVEATAEVYTITATGSGGTPPYTYSLDGQNFQDSGTFSDLAVQDYTITIKDANECTSTAEITAESLETFTDPRDGQTYKVVTIGDQIWMAENLNYRGNDVNYVCYDDNIANCDTYGPLYTWEQAHIAAPEGWHVPTDDEWEALETELGGSDVAGGAMKVGGGSGFDGLYGGQYENIFFGIEEYGVWWGGENNETLVIYYYIGINNDLLSSFSAADKILDKQSVRCIKD